MPLSLNSSSFTCSIRALAAIILQLVAMECQKLHMADLPIVTEIGKQSLTQKKTAIGRDVLQEIPRNHMKGLLRFPLQYLFILAF